MFGLCIRCSTGEYIIPGELGDDMNLLPPPNMLVVNAIGESTTPLVAPGDESSNYFSYNNGSGSKDGQLDRSEATMVVVRMSQLTCVIISFQKRKRNHSNFK